MTEVAALALVAAPGAAALVLWTTRGLKSGDRAGGTVAASLLAWGAIGCLAWWLPSSTILTVPEMTAIVAGAGLLVAAALWAGVRHRLPGPWGAAAGAIAGVACVMPGLGPWRAAAFVAASGLTLGPLLGKPPPTFHAAALGLACVMGLAFAAFGAYLLSTPTELDWRVEVEPDDDAPCELRLPYYHGPVDEVAAWSSTGDIQWRMGHDSVHATIRGPATLRSDATMYGTPAGIRDWTFASTCHAQIHAVVPEDGCSTTRLAFRLEATTYLAQPRRTLCD